MTDDLQVLEAELGDRLRLTLHTVAETAVVSDAPDLTRRRWGRLAASALAAVVAVGGVAAFFAQNDDAIVRLPVEEALISGDTDSGQWWMFPTEAVVDTCRANFGVVLVAEEINKPGQELNAGGVVYGEPPDSNLACAPFDQDGWLQIPGRSDITHSRLGFERDDTPWGVLGTFHPTVAAVRVQVDDTAAFVVATVARPDRPDGPRYVAFVVPTTASTARIELLDEDGSQIPPTSRHDAEELTRHFR